MAPLKQIAVRIPEDVVLRARLFARSKGYKFQAIVAIAMTQYLDREGAPQVSNLHRRRPT